MGRSEVFRDRRGEFRFTLRPATVKPWRGRELKDARGVPIVTRRPRSAGRRMPPSRMLTSSTVTQQEEDK
jgi:hypothetical protein